MQHFVGNYNAYWTKKSMQILGYNHFRENALIKSSNGNVTNKEVQDNHEHQKYNYIQHTTLLKTRRLIITILYYFGENSLMNSETAAFCQKRRLGEKMGKTYYFMFSDNMFSTPKILQYYFSHNHVMCYNNPHFQWK